MKRFVLIVLALFFAGLGPGLVYAQTEQASKSGALNSEALESKTSEFTASQLEPPGPEPPKSKLSRPRASESEAVEFKAPVLQASLSEGLSKKVSLDLRGMDIIDTIKFLSMKGNLNIVTSKNVNGRITLFLNNVAISDALDVILLTNKLACERKKNIITIMTEAEYEALYGRKYNDKRQLKTITLKYADPADVSAALSNVKSEIGKVIADTGTGKLILIDTPEKIEEMGKIIEEFDLPTIERVLPAVTEVFELAYAKAKDIEPEISKSLTKDVGTIRIDEKTNKLVVRDLPYNMDRIKRLVREFDAKPRQVLVEAEIVEVTLSDGFHTGVDWKKLLTRVHNLTFEGTFPFSYTGASSLAVSVGTLADDGYELALELIKSVGKVKIVSSPHIAVCNNEEAKFMVGSREAYVTTTTTTGQVTTTTSEAVEFIDVGVNLYVTPTINKDGFIKMHIKPEVSSVGEWLETSSGNKIPIVDTSNVETDVLIKDGKTIVIAGLIKETTTKTINKIPFLGDIPLLGLLFRNKVDKKEKKELVIFLTPHIISGEKDLFYIKKAGKPRKPPKDGGYIKGKKRLKPAKK